MAEDPPAHLLRTYDMKPPHDLINTEKCDCSIGKDHSQYGTKSD